MRRKFILVSILIIAVLFFAGLANGEPRIRNCQSMGGQITVTLDGKAERDCWLGCTIILKNGREIDLQVKKIRGPVSGQVYFWSTFDIGLTDVRTWEKIYVALWRKKVRCNMNDSHARDGCKKFGYVMEGFIDDASCSP